MKQIVCPHCGGSEIVIHKKRAYCRSLTRDNGKRCFWHFSMAKPQYKVWGNAENRICRTPNCKDRASHGNFCSICRNIRRRNNYQLRKKQEKNL